jgi:FMN phosphatase YigB (HAD superfamily)
MIWKVVFDMSKQKAIIVDLDGTLFDIEHRRKYVDGSLGKKDWKKFYEGIPDDTVNKWCLSIIIALLDRSDDGLDKIELIFVTGRPSNHRYETYLKLNAHLSKKQCSNLLMRLEGDFREDYIVKEEIYNEYIKDNYDVLFALDDRSQVVKMWRKNGIVCLQCAEGNF